MRRHKVDSRLYSANPEDRLDAAHDQGRRAARGLVERVGDWPPNAPGSVNAWLLLVTTKEPVWRDPMVQWQDHPLTLGTAHQGFYYPDPMGFWAELRRWAVELFRLRQPRWGATEALALTALLPAGSQPPRVARALEVLEPRLVLFLDEPSWVASRAVLEVDRVPHYINDPHRPKQTYEGFWGTRPDGVVVGKSPQHPATHNLYRADDILGYLRSAPIPRPPSDGP
jgi:hypothetical protein